MVFNKELIRNLKGLYKDEGENMCIIIHIYDADVATVAGIATVFLSPMIEESTSLLRYEVDIQSTDDSDIVIGTVVVDVRGYSLLKKYCR